MGLVRLTDKDLVQKVVHGDGAAFSLLVARWEKKLFNYAYRLTGDREDAFDICQDAFTRAYQQLAQLKDASKFSFWLFKIARNCCMSRFRQAKHLPQMESANGEEDELDLDNLLLSSPQIRIGSGQSYNHNELRLIVGKALDQIPFEQRDTIVLKIFEGLKFSEIAEIADCPISTVKSRLYLGLTQLKRILTQDQREGT